MSTSLGIALVNLWRSGKHGTTVGDAAVRQILADAHPDTISDILHGTPISSIKQGIQALQQAWDLFEQEVLHFQRKGGIFEGVHLSAQDCFIISTMIPTLIPPGLGEAAFLTKDNTHYHRQTADLTLKRKREEDLEEEVPGAKKKASSWPTGIASRSSQGWQGTSGEPSHSVNRSAQPFAFSPWSEMDDRTSLTSPINGIARLSMDGPSQVGSQKRKIEDFRQMIIQADVQLSRKRVKLGKIHDVSHDRMAKEVSDIDLIKSEPTDEAVHGKGSTAPTNMKQEDWEEESNEASLWSIPRFSSS